MFGLHEDLNVKWQWMCLVPLKQLDIYVFWPADNQGHSWCCKLLC